MKVALVTHNVIHGDGQGRVNYEVAREALRRGHRLTLVATQVDPDMAAEAGVTWVRVPVAVWPTQLTKNQVFAWRASRWLRQHAHKFDVVKACGFVCWSRTDINAVHLVHSAWRRSPVHTSRVRRGPYAWYHWFYSASNAWLETLAFRRSRSIVAVSHQVKRELVEAGVPGSDIRVILNGVDTDEFRPGPGERSHFGLPDDVPIALFVGDIRSPIKNLDTVLRALVRIPPLHLAVAGNLEGSPFPAIARQFGLQERVHFLGFRRDVPDLMRSVDCFVLPSRYESFSLVLLEAMATGLPVVTARTVGASEIVTPESGIVMSDPNDEEELARGLRRLVLDPEGRAATGAAARRVALEHSFRVMANEYVDLLESQSVVPGGQTPV